MSEAPIAEKSTRRRAPWRGRPRAVNARGKRIALRVSDDDLQIMEQMATDAGLSVGAFLRALALGSAGARARKRPSEEREALARILGEIGKLGSNVNQIARWCNTDRTAPQLREVELIRGDIAAIRAALMGALDRGN